MISDSYLIILNIALVRTGEDYWADPLWHKDLLLHLDVIAKLTLACPIERRAVPEGWQRVNDPRIRIIALPPMRGWRSLLALPRITWTVNQAMHGVRIVHTGVAGWPFPFGWIAIPLARLRGKFVIVVVESSFWRAMASDGWSKRLKAKAFEAINRWCLARTDISFFTTSTYRDDLAGANRMATHIAPASWVDAAQMLDVASAAQSWAAKLDRFLFAGRLTEAKGVAVLIEAIERSSAKVDLIGNGPLEDKVRALAARLPDRVRLLEPVSYGADFFALIDRYPALIVPTLTDEQPRIVVDAFARAVPVIASDARGNRDLAIEGETARVVPAGDAQALARALDEAGGARHELCRLGQEALARTGRMTHQAMHLDRAAVIATALKAKR